MATATPIPAMAEACAVELFYKLYILCGGACGSWTTSEVSLGAARYSEVYPHSFCLVGIHEWWLGRRDNLHLWSLFARPAFFNWGRLSSLPHLRYLTFVILCNEALHSIHLADTSSSASRLLCTLSTGTTNHALHPDSSPLYSLSPIPYPLCPNSQFLLHPFGSPLQ